jgi:CRP/FNR family transcriptional regulator
MADVVSLSNHPTRCRECRYASDCPLLDDNGSALESVVQSRIRVLHDGDRLFRIGDRVEAVYRVRTGVVKTSLTGNDGCEQVTGFFGPGEWVGLDAMDGQRHGTESVALDTASVCVIPYATLRERLCTSSRAARVMVSVMSNRLVSKENMHLALARDNAGQRLAGFLLDLSERRAAADLDADDIALPMSRGEIASYLALAVETVSRLLTRMHRAGTIAVYRTHVEITDREALKALAGRPNNSDGDTQKTATR